jgi:hypothetical protein
LGETRSTNFKGFFKSTKQISPKTYSHYAIGAIMSATNFYAFTKAITGNGTSTSDPKDIGAYSTGLVLTGRLSNFTDGSYVVTLQHSIDGGSTWVDVTSMTALAAAGGGYKSVTDYVISLVRLKVVASTVTTGATIDARIYWDKLR